jgi:hypothetical protein
MIRSHYIGELVKHELWRPMAHEIETLLPKMEKTIAWNPNNRTFTCQYIRMNLLLARELRKDGREGEVTVHINQAVEFRKKLQPEQDIDKGYYNQLFRELETALPSEP